MSIQYKMVRQNDNMNPDGQKKAGYYPRVVRDETLNLKKITRIASRGSTFQPFEMEAAVSLLLQHIEQELLDSNHVCLDGFGTFSLTAESRLVENPDEIRAESIQVKRVVFTPSPRLMKRIKNARFVRAVEGK